MLGESQNWRNNVRTGTWARSGSCRLAIDVREADGISRAPDLGILAPAVDQLGRDRVSTRAESRPSVFAVQEDSGRSPNLGLKALGSKPPGNSEPNPCPYDLCIMQCRAAGGHRKLIALADVPGTAHT